MYKNLGTLEKAAAEAKGIGDIKKQANYYRDSVIPAMNELRAPADEIESLVGEKYWPYPTYGALLFYVILGAVVLVIYVLALLIMWLQKYRQSKKLTDQLKKLQTSE